MWWCAQKDIIVLMWPVWWCSYCSWDQKDTIDLTWPMWSVPEYSVNITGIYSSLPEWYFGECRHYQNTLCLLSECYLISISVVDIFIFISKTYSLIKFVLIVDIMYFSVHIYFAVGWPTFSELLRKVCVQSGALATDNAEIRCILCSHNGFVQYM